MCNRHHLLALGAVVVLFIGTPGLGSGIVLGQNGSWIELKLPGGSVFRTTEAQVSNTRIVAVPDSNAFVALWDERSASGEVTPFYAISLTGGPFEIVRPTSYRIGIRSINGDPLSQLIDVTPELRADESTDVWLVQFVCQPLVDFRQTIAKLGPKQAYYNALLAGDLASYLRAQALPTDLPAGRVVVNRLSFCHRGSSLSPGWWPTRTGTSIPRHHESNSTPQRPIHLPGYGVNAS